jgi:flagellar hook-associated protein 2
MASITAVGTGSGLDLESLVTSIVNAEKVPVETRLAAREAKVQASISALGGLKSTLADFQKAIGKLKDASAFATRSATSSNTSLFSASASSGADLGSYAIGVVQMASPHKLASGNFDGASAVVGSGTLHIASGGSSFNVDIRAGDNDSLSGIRDAINNAPGNNGVRASLLTVSDGDGGTATKLVLTAANSGSEGAISVSVTDADGDDSDGGGLSRLRYDAADPAFDPENPAFEAGRVTVSSPARDAIITVDGFEVRSSTNVFDKTLPGVTLTLLKAGSEGEEGSSEGELTVSENKNGIKGAIEGFIASYNALNGVLRQLTGADASGESRGLLSGDSSIGVVQSRLRSIMGSVIEGAPAGFDSLSALGIRTERDGSISLDGATVDKALADNFEGLNALFTGSNGLAGKLDKAVGDLLGSNGMFAIRQESLDRQLSDIGDQRSQLALRLEKVEARYRAQFSALDILVAQLNQTSDFLTQQLETLNVMGNNRGR